MIKYNKNIRSTRTYKFPIADTQSLRTLFQYAQNTQCLYFNYGLKFLYQHYGVSHLNNYLPTGVTRQYLINKIKTFARSKALTHNFNLKDMDFNIQSTDKMLEQLIVNFDKYRRAQYKRLHYWSKKDTETYLKTHNCSLSGYMRISYKQNSEDIRSFTLKKNGNRIYLNNNYNIKLPYFNNVQTTKSMTILKNKDIMEARIVKLLNRFELQVIIKFNKERVITKQETDNIVGLDVNLANNKFFVFSDSNVISWSKDIEQKHKTIDSKCRTLQKYITNHNYGNDNSLQTKNTRVQLNKLKNKLSNIIDNWQLQTAKYISNKYPVLAMEELNSFQLRMSKRINKFLRKNTNHKLATIQPTTFRTYMETAYQNDGHLLLEVNTIDTSKTCNHCHYINHDLRVGMKTWQCPNCSKILDRDLNATMNIRDWGVNPNQHAVMQQRNRFPYFNTKNLVTIV